MVYINFDERSKKDEKQRGQYFKIRKEDIRN